MVCDGTSFDVEGSPVRGKATFLAETRLSCDAMVNACAAAKGSPGTCQGALPVADQEKPIACPSGDTYTVKLPAGSQICQDRFYDVAKAHACDDYENISVAEKALNATCAVPPG